MSQKRSNTGQGPTAKRPRQPLGELAPRQQQSFATANPQQVNFHKTILGLVLAANFHFDMVNIFIARSSILTGNVNG